MKLKQGVIQDVRYEEDSKACIIHVDCEDGAHTATLPIEDVEKHGFTKGMKVEATIDDDGNATGLEYFK
jgi:hypothetical protein